MYRRVKSMHYPESPKVTLQDYPLIRPNSISPFATSRFLPLVLAGASICPDFFPDPKLDLKTAPETMKPEQQK